MDGIEGWGHFDTPAVAASGDAASAMTWLDLPPRRHGRRPQVNQYTSFTTYSKKSLITRGEDLTQPTV